MVAGQITITYEASDEPLVVNVPANVGVTAGQALDIVRSELGLSGTLRDQAGALCPPGYQLQAGSAYRFTAARGGHCVQEQDCKLPPKAGRCQQRLTVSLVGDAPRAAVAHGYGVSQQLQLLSIGKSSCKGSFYLVLYRITSEASM